MPKNAVENQLDPDNLESEHEFERRMKRRKKNPRVRMYDRQVAAHPHKWGLIYPLLELIRFRNPLSTDTTSLTPMVICQRTSGGPMTLGSLPLTDTKKYFKDIDPDAGIPAHKVYLHVEMSNHESPLTPYCPIVPGASNFWFVDYDEEHMSSETLALHRKEDLYHLSVFQESFIEFSESKFANINTTLVVYNLIPSRHAQELKESINKNGQRMKTSIKALCSRKSPWMDDLSKTAKPKRFGPSNMYQISLSRGIELMSYEVGGLRVLFKNFSAEDGDEECPACKGDEPPAPIPLRFILVCLYYAEQKQDNQGLDDDWIETAVKEMVRGLLN
ncbi:hypothetical protein I317_01359 [Kwoniella heveanensis CBS 569]|nr:hypothetical protein I317_01359 [Kwoniella heveanensis CBS 569]